MLHLEVELTIDSAERRWVLSYDDRTIRPGGTAGKKEVEADCLVVEVEASLVEQVDRGLKCPYDTLSHRSTFSRLV